MPALRAWCGALLPCFLPRHGGLATAAAALESSTSVSIFTLHRYTTHQLQQAHERLRRQCPLTGYSRPIDITGDDPHDPKDEAEPKTKRRQERHYRIKNH